MRIYKAAIKAMGWEYGYREDDRVFMGARPTSTTVGWIAWARKLGEDGEYTYRSGSARTRVAAVGWLAQQVGCTPDQIETRR